MARFLADACPSDRVRRAEATGVDAELWSQLIAQGVLEISVPEDLGGNPLVDLALVSEELGYVLAPAPFPEVAAAVAVLATLSDPVAKEVLADVLEGRELVTLDLEGSALKGGVNPTGAVSRRHLSLDGLTLVLAKTEAVGVIRVADLEDGVDRQSVQRLVPDHRPLAGHPQGDLYVDG